MTVIKIVKQATFIIECECGNIVSMPRSRFLALKGDFCQACKGSVNSGSGNPNFKHGGYTEFKYERNSWRAAKARCYNPNYRRFDIYGGRGIKMCDRWLGKDGFINFLADMGPKPSPKHSLDRINNGGDYEPDNCRWATQKEQLANSSRVNLITIGGVTDSFSGHAVTFGISPSVAYNRVHQFGWDEVKALTTPVVPQGYNHTTHKS